MKRSGNSLRAGILSDFWTYEFQLREFLNINSHHVTLFSWLLYWWVKWSVVPVASSEKNVSVRTCIWKVYSLQSTYEPKSLWQWTIWSTTQQNILRTFSWAQCRCMTQHFKYGLPKKPNKFFTWKLEAGKIKTRCIAQK